MKKRILSSLLACSLLFTVVAAPAIAFADDFDTQIEQKNKEITELQSKQAALQSQISSLEAEVAGINAKAQELFAKKETLTKELKQFIQHSRIDELMISSPIYSHQDKLKSLRILKEVVDSI